MRIILLTDFSPHAASAAGVAIKLAKLERKDVEIVHIEEEQEHGASTERLLKQLKDTFFQKGIVAHCHTLECSIENISEQIKLTTEDLIIMGTHGHKGWKEKWIGTFTQKLLRTSPAPILAVPLHLNQWTLEEILFVSDFDDLSLDKTLLERIHSTFKSFSPEIHLLKIFSPDDDSMNQKTDDLESLQLPYRTFHKVRLEHFKTIEQAIFEQAETIDADIIALKTHARSGWFHSLLGSTAESVLIQAKVPVWVQRVSHEG
jgi:nucleotide-binding universal stress UspA family protein